MQQALNSPVFNFLGDWIENTSEVPGQIIELGYDLSGDLKDTARQGQDYLSQRSQDAADNIRDTEVQKAGAGVFSWLQDPVNLVGSIVLLILVFWGVRNA